MDDNEYLALVDAAVGAMSSLLMASHHRDSVAAFWPALVEADYTVNGLQDTIRERVGWTDPLDDQTVLLKYQVEGDGEVWRDERR